LDTSLSDDDTGTCMMMENLSEIIQSLSSKCWNTSRIPRDVESSSLSSIKEEECSLNDENDNAVLNKIPGRTKRFLQRIRPKKTHAAAAPPISAVVTRIIEPHKEEFPRNHKQPGKKERINNDHSIRRGSTNSILDSDDSHKVDEVGDEDDSFFEGSIGKTLISKYRITKELGRGTFGRVVECKKVNWKNQLRSVVLPSPNHRKDDKKSIYAVKIVRKNYRKDASIEADMLRVVNLAGDDNDDDNHRGRTHFPILYDLFDIPQGYRCLVMERLGLSLYDVMKQNNFEPFPVTVIRDVSLQLFNALDHLYSICQIVHTDIKPENLLLVADDNMKYHSYDHNNDDISSSRDNASATRRSKPGGSKLQIKLIDFGSAVYHYHNTIYHNNTTIVNTREYRAPEILLHLGWSYPSDIWAAGCTIAELALGHYLFNVGGGANDTTSEHLALIERKINVFPRKMLTTTTGNYFPNLTCQPTTTIVSSSSSTNTIVEENFDMGLMGCRHKMEKILSTYSLNYLNSITTTLKEDLEERQQPLWELLNLILNLDPKSRPLPGEVLDIINGLSF